MATEDPLISACFLGQVNRAKRLASRENVNQGDENKSTPLMWAAFRGNTQIVEHLLSLGAEIDAINSYGRTALMMAAQNNQVDSLCLLTQHGANPTITDKWGEGFYDFGDYPSQNERAVLDVMSPEVKEQFLDKRKKDTQKWASTQAPDLLFQKAQQYRTGTEKVDKDEKKALELYEMSANAGFAPALVHLGFCYHNGLGCAVDVKRAVEYYQKAHAAGNANGSYNLGVCYELGSGGLPVDETTAVGYFMHAAETGHARSQAKVGYAYYQGKGGLEQDHLQAKQWFARAAIQGNSVAQANLGIFYSQGLGGLPKDAEKAADLFKTSAAKRNIHAQYYLANCYFDGRGVQSAPRRAVALYSLGANRGHAWASYKLAKCYENGLGINKDKAKAITYYEKSAGWGLEVARQALQQLASSK